MPLLAGLFTGVGSILFLGSVITLLLTGDLKLSFISIFRAIAAAIALILLGTEVAATVALTSALGLIVTLIMSVL